MTPAEIDRRLALARSAANRFARVMRGEVPITELVIRGETRLMRVRREATKAVIERFGYRSRPSLGHENYRSFKVRLADEIVRRLEAEGVSIERQVEPSPMPIARRTFNGKIRRRFSTRPERQLPEVLR